MPKPKQIFLLEVKYLGRTPYLAPGGGIFRTEKDMNQRIATVKSRRKGVPVRLTVSKVAGDWETVSETEIE